MRTCGNEVLVGGVTTRVINPVTKRHLNTCGFTQGLGPKEKIKGRSTRKKRFEVDE